MTKSTLDLATEGLYKELERVDNDFSKIPEITRPIALLYMFQGMVDNGGFQYPMENNFPGCPPYSAFVDAYRSIGALEAATALEQAVALFPFDHPERNEDARCEFFESIEEDSLFDQLSRKVCGDESIWKSMDEYVAKHHKDFAPFITQ
jgi:hypothetical protein